MNLEIQKPELVQRVNAQIQSRHLHDADELIEQALDALDEKSPASEAAPTKDIEELFAPRRGLNIDFSPTRPPDARSLYRQSETSIYLFFHNLAEFRPAHLPPRLLDFGHVYKIRSPFDAGGPGNRVAFCPPFNPSSSGQQRRDASYFPAPQTSPLLTEVPAPQN
jgi:hypothetical protein